MQGLGSGQGLALLVGLLLWSGHVEDQRLKQGLMQGLGSGRGLAPLLVGL